MHTRSVKLVLVLLLVVCVGGALPLWSQSASSGTVSGSVTDQSNAVVAGAAITLTDTATNISRTANSNATGRYFFADVTPGTYSLTVAKAGICHHEDREPDRAGRSQSHGQFVFAGGRRECGGGGLLRRQ